MVREVIVSPLGYIRVSYVGISHPSPGYFIPGYIIPRIVCTSEMYPTAINLVKCF